MKISMKAPFVFVLLTAMSQVTFAAEGMWLPQLLQLLNERDMKKAGMKISAADIYSVNKGSLKDAIVSLGGFCTAEVISDKGLILTNHHCGFDAIQNHSTLQNNYIRDGFWSKNQSEELTNPGLFATFIIRIDDVTDIITKGTAGLAEKDRQQLIDKNISDYRKNGKKEEYQDVMVRPMFEGNKYYAFVTETYRDVRLVGAPPSSIGNFGKDTDNWMWPRHTGDFSLFRIYADKNNRPAPYSPDNVPYKPKRSLNISLDGVTENDFTMVFGFPGRTTEYLPSVAVSQIMNVTDPAKINIRERALRILDENMRRDEQIKILYAAKYARIENYHKKWSGEVKGLKQSNAVAKKKQYEEEFQKRVSANADWAAKYGNLLRDLETAYAEIEPYAFARDYYIEITSKLDILGVANQLNALANAYEKSGTAGYNSYKTKALEVLGDIYPEMNSGADKQMFETLMAMYVKDMKKEYIPASLTAFTNGVNNNYKTVTDSLYRRSLCDDSSKIYNILSMQPADAVAKIREDFAVQMIADIQKAYNDAVGTKLTDLQNRINNLQRTYMAAQMEVFKEKTFYPDANSTLRVTYGNVKGYQPRDAVNFGMYTYLDGVMQKYVPGDYEFDVPKKLIDLYNSKDFGQYGTNGRQAVCFIATNHTTGGNSGSPALDAQGNLVGLNFDRVWEGTMSDINYDPTICRNIMVDIRYVAFIIDKFADAQNIVSELKFVHPKKSNSRPAKAEKRKLAA